MQRPNHLQEKSVCSEKFAEQSRGTQQADIDIEDVHFQPTLFRFAVSEPQQSEESGGTAIKPALRFDATIAAVSEKKQLITEAAEAFDEASGSSSPPHVTI